MDFDAAGFLAGLFDGGAVASVTVGELGAPAAVTGWEPRDAGPQDLPGCDPLGVVSAHGDDGDAGQDLQPQDGDAGEWQEYIDPDGRRGWVRADVADCEVVDLQPCPNCDGMVSWWDAAGGAHCEACSPAPGRGQRLQQRAAELRGRYPATRQGELQPRSLTVPRTWPAAVPSEIIADPIPTCSDCGRPRSVVGGQPGRPLGFCFSCWSKRR